MAETRLLIQRNENGSKERNPIFAVEKLSPHKKVTESTKVQKRKKKTPLNEKTRINIVSIQITIELIIKQIHKYKFLKTQGYQQF